jgi:hypothetical protein
MLSVRPVADVAIRASSFPAGGHGAIVLPDAIAAREAADHDFELALLARIARANRHAETEK